MRAEYIFIENDLNQISDYILAYQPGRIKIINLWHGEPIKKIGFDANNNSNKKRKNPIYFFLYKNFFNKKVILGTTCSKISQNNLNTSQLTNKFKITGLARNDIFFNSSLITKNIKKELGIINKKIILYVPTYRDSEENYTPIYFDEQFKKYLEKNNYLFLIKAHQGDKNLIMETSKNIIDISNLNYDIQETMYFSDILITDYSSIYIDFLLTNKPIIFYPFDKKEYLKNRNMYFSYDKISIKETTAYNEKEFKSIIYNINSIKKNIQYIKKYTILKNFLHKNQKGNFCKNILTNLSKLGKKSS